jgi:hypothetical protein
MLAFINRRYLASYHNRPTRSQQKSLAINVKRNAGICLVDRMSDETCVEAGPNKFGGWLNVPLDDEMFDV